MQKLGFTGVHGRQSAALSAWYDALQGPPAGAPRGDAAAQARFMCLLAMLKARGGRLSSTACGPDVYGCSCMS